MIMIIFRIKIPCGLYTPQGIYPAGCIPRGVYTPQGIYPAGYIHRGVYTPRGIRGPECESTLANCLAFANILPGLEHRENDPVFFCFGPERESGCSRQALFAGSIRSYDHNIRIHTGRQRRAIGSLGIELLQFRFWV